MTTRELLLPPLLLLTACASGSYEANAARPHITAPSGDIFEEAGKRLASRIPAGSNVAIAPPSIDVRQDFGQASNLKAVQSELTTRASGYPIRLEGAVVESLTGTAALMTRTHLEPLLQEHELKWSLLASDPGSRKQLAALTNVDVLITWNICTQQVKAINFYNWTYQEEWTLQLLRIETGELLGSVTLRRPASWSD